MAVNYNPPPWLRGASPMEAVVPGASLGQRIFESNQRSALAWEELQQRKARLAQQAELEQQQLQQQQEFQQQRFQAQQQVAQQEQMRDDQKLQIENAYHQAQLGLAKQKLDMTAAAAAQKMDASQRFVQSLATLQSGYMAEEGMDEGAARQKAVPQALFDSGLFQYIPPTALAGMLKSSTSQEAQWKTSPSGMPYAQEPSGNIRFEPKPTPNPVMRSDVSDINANIKALDKQFREETDETKKGKIEDELIRLSELRSVMLKRSQSNLVPRPAQAPQPDTSAPAEAPKAKRFRYDPKSDKVVPIDETPDEEDNAGNP